MALQKNFCLFYCLHFTPFRIICEKQSTKRIKSKPRAASNPDPMRSSPTYWPLHHVAVAKMRSLQLQFVYLKSFRSKPIFFCKPLRNMPPGLIFRGSPVFNLRSDCYQGRAQKFKKGGLQFKAMPAGLDIFSLRKKRTGSLNAITSVFRPKSSEMQKRSSRPQMSDFPPKVIKKVFTPSDCPFYVYHICTTKVSYICLRGGAAPALPPLDTSLITLAAHLFYKMKFAGKPRGCPSPPT